MDIWLKLMPVSLPLVFLISMDLDLSSMPNQLILYHVRLNSRPDLLESMILEVIKTPQSPFWIPLPLLASPQKVAKVESWQQKHGNTHWKSLKTWFLSPHPTAINLHFFQPKRSSTCWRTRCGGSMTSLLLTLNGRCMGISNWFRYPAVQPTFQPPRNEGVEFHFNPFYDSITW